MTGGSFALLGPLEARGPKGALLLRGSVGRQLLAILLLAEGHPISEERLIDHVWGAVAPPSARRTLQAHVSRLRAALTGAGLEGKLVRRGGGYALEVEREQFDVSRFQARLAQGRDAMDREKPEAALEHLEEALAEWRGDPLSEFALTQWASEDQQRLRELEIEARELQLEARVMLGRHAEAIADLRRLLADHPLRERSWQLLMVALYRSGRQADALEAYAAAQDGLREELGIEPGPGLRAMHLAVLRQDPSLDLPPAPVSERGRFIMGKLQERKLEYLFRAVDRDGDGFVARSDFEGHGRRLAALADPGSPEAELVGASVVQWWDGIHATAGVDQADINHWLEFWSGWLTAVSADADAGGGEALEQMKTSIELTLKAIDNDRDGIMSAAEYANWIRCWGFDIDVELAFKRLDIDGDGGLDYDEAARAVKEFFLSNDPEAPGNYIYGSPF